MKTEMFTAVDGGTISYGIVQDEKTTRYGFEFTNCAGKSTNISDTDAAKILMSSLKFILKIKIDLENQIIRMNKNTKEKT